MHYLYYFKRLLPFFIYFIIAGCINSTAQEVITPSAGYFETPSMSLNWTIGEIAIETYFNENIMLTQGFNQANIIITSNTEDFLTDISISFYPNPVKDIFTIKAETDYITQLTAEVYDLAGTKLISENINPGNTQINTESLTTSEYILKIYDNQNVIKSFKFIKTN
jgi:hypothetical protein